MVWNKDSAPFMGKHQLYMLGENMLTISNIKNLITPENESILSIFLQIKHCMIVCCMFRA